MRRRWVGALAALLACAFVSSAHASVYDFSYYASGGPSGREFGRGTITLSNTDPDGFYQVLDIDGSANRSIITGLSDYAGADNIVYANGPLVDQGGISFSTASGTDYNFYSLDNAYAVLSSTTEPYAWASNRSPLNRLCATYVSSAVPEPSTWLLLIAGIGGIGLMLRRAKQTMGFRFKDAFSA